MASFQAAKAALISFYETLLDQKLE
ncbi:hypothetical protein CCACVL1_10951 [Corchorus capsularis]|uniref:Uncharacterized protein n=1 Tax=Corchorus capsularis TaxID=210143 RepID=A0A1R3INN6_COCAP|nr:hypothetical protein CCACVL1_10951 [Corchorus capsularis]